MLWAVVSKTLGYLIAIKIVGKCKNKRKADTKMVFKVTFIYLTMKASSQQQNCRCPVILYPPIRLSGGMNKSIPRLESTGIEYPP